MQRGWKLLIVEDDEDLRDTLRELAESFIGCQVIEAENGVDGMRVIQSLQGAKSGLDAILTDIKMPVMDGLDMLGKVRDMGVITPVIVLTGHGDKNSAMQALQLGAFDFIEKPFETGNLLSRLQAALHLGQSLRSVDDDVEKMISKYDLPPEEAEKLRNMNRMILIARRKSTAA